MPTKNNNKKPPARRYRNWGLIVYPESAPENWLEIIKAERVPCAYILHDKDEKVTEDGEVVLKKPHYHVLLKYNTQKSYTQMLRLTGKLRAPNPMQIECLAGYCRDFLHLDDDSPYQHRYHISEVHTLRGFDFAEQVKPNKTERHAILRDIRRISADEGITEFVDLYLYFDKVNPVYSKEIDERSHAVGRFVDSMRYKMQKQQMVKDVTPQPSQYISAEPIEERYVMSYQQEQQIEEIKEFTLKEAGYLDLETRTYSGYSY